MTEQDKIKIVMSLASELVDKANELAQVYDISLVSSAIRFAAARYNSFEASMRADDLGALRETALNWFVKEYKTMLEENLDEYIKQPARA